jgi:hypothetical protein
VSDEQDRGSLPEGTLVGGRFRVERLIGRGGMGEVYAARHSTTGKEVALKLILTAGSSKEHVRRFMREARAATAIDHPNVIEVFDVFEDADGTPVMVMELLKGEPFSRLLERAGALELHQVSEILLPAIRALQVAHSKGIVHRDLKPDNIFLANTPSGRTTKLLDFGIAKLLDPTKLGSETQGQHTNTGSILGTPHYMSFEQAMSDKHVDQRTDIWAMGVIIFESLTGRRPLMYDTLGQMYATFLQGTVPSIRDFVPDTPEDAARVLDHCLGKERAQRLGDLGPLIEVLAKYADSELPGARAGGRVVAAPLRLATEVTAAPTASSVAGLPPKRRWRAAPTIAAVVVVGAGLGTGAWALSRKNPPVVSPPPLATAQASTAGPAGAAASTETLPPAVTPSVDMPSPSPTVSAAARPPRGGGGVAAVGPRPSASAVVPPPPPSAKKGISEKLPY